MCTHRRGAYRWLAAILLALLCLARPPAAAADPGGIAVSFKAGSPTELKADGQSKTTLIVEIVDEGHACWGGPIAEGGQFTLLAGAALVAVDPNNKVGIQFPAEVTVTAGAQSGTAEIKLQVSYCPKDAVGAFGVCSDPNRGLSKCEAEIQIPVGDAPADPGPPKEPGSEETELEAALACTGKKGDAPGEGKPEEGKPLVCTATLRGAREDETFEYVWYVDGQEMASTSAPTWTWERAAAGDHDIGVDLSSNDGGRSTGKTIQIHVPAAAQPEQPPAQPEQPPAQPEQPPAQPEQPPAQPAQPPAQPEQPPEQPEQPAPPAEGGGLPLPDAGEAIEITRFQLLTQTLTDVAVEQRARDPSAPARGIAAGAAALETIALVIANLGTAARSQAKTAGPPAPARQKGDAGSASPAPARAPSSSVAESRRRLAEVARAVPAGLRGSERWRERVAPLIERAQGWTDPAKLEKLARRIELVARRRRNIEAHPRARRLDERHKETLAWTSRGREIFPPRFAEAQQKQIVEPAKRRVERLSAPRSPDALDRMRRRTTEAVDRMRTQVHNKARALMGRGRGRQKAPDGVLDPYHFPSPPPTPRREPEALRHLRAIYHHVRSEMRRRR